ncbi:MAG: N-acetyltransferase [Pseudomonadota bacterium]
MMLRDETPADVDAISTLTTKAFSSQPHSSGTEAQIIDALRAEGDLTLSLVAVDQGVIVGQITFSPVAISGAHDDWFGLGPVSVQPERQGKGIGASLVLEGLDRLRQIGAKGCVLVGDPAYYGRFGFSGNCGLVYGDLDPIYVQGLVLSPPARTGTIQYADAFQGA